MGGGNVSPATPGTARRGGPSRVVLGIGLPPLASPRGAVRGARRVLSAVRTCAGPALGLPRWPPGLGLPRYGFAFSGTFSLLPPSVGPAEERVLWLGPRELELSLTFCLPELRGPEACLSSFASKE